MADYQKLSKEEAKNYILNAPATYWREGIFLHNTANQGYSGVSGMEALLTHLNNLGWKNAFYHFVVDPDGTIWRFAPIEGIANHIGSGYNASYIAISLQGNYNIQYATPAQADSVAFLCKAVAQRYDVPAMPRFHRDVDATACPGWNITKELVTQWVAGNTGYQPPTTGIPIPIPSVDLTFKSKPNVPFPPFNFIKGSGEALGLGDEALQVRDLELSLYFLGYLNPQPRADGTPYQWTYVFDEGTEGAVKAFQEKFVPPADGVYGINTATSLKREVDRKWSGMPTGEVPAPPVTPPSQPEPAVSPPRRQPPVEDSVLEEPKPGEEVQSTLDKILALLQRIVEWVKIK